MGKDRLTGLLSLMFLSIFLLVVLYAQEDTTDGPGFYEKLKDKKINISFKDTDIDDVIEIFADKMGINIIRNENVKAKITANLKDINVIDALDFICKTHGINYLVEESIMSEPIIRIYTKEDYLEALMYKGKAEVIKLKYSKAGDVYKKLQEAGAIKGKEGGTYGAGIFYADEKSNSIIIVDKETALNHSKLRKVIEAFDQPTPQVLIEAKILTVALSDETRYGINWSLIWQNGATEQPDVVMPFAGNKNEDFSITKIWKLKNNSGSFSGLLTALGEQGDVKVLSSPRIVVLNNEDAKIIEGKNEPYTVTTTTPSPGGPVITSDTKFIEVGVGLTVTPQINKNNIILKIKPNISSAAARESLSDPPTVTKSEAETIVSVNNKDTLVLGGLIQTRKYKIVKKIPLLGSIPLLGYLFSSRTYSTRRSELVIFLTPTIIKETTGTKEDFKKLKKTEDELKD